PRRGRALRGPRRQDLEPAGPRGRASRRAQRPRGRGLRPAARGPVTSPPPSARLPVVTGAASPTTEEGRAFLQERLAFYARIAFFLSIAFFVVGVTLARDIDDARDPVGLDRFLAANLLLLA